jgi:hypothetical protein
MLVKGYTEAELAASYNQSWLMSPNIRQLLIGRGEFYRKWSEVKNKLH